MYNTLEKGRRTQGPSRSAHTHTATPSPYSTTPFRVAFSVTLPARPHTETFVLTYHSLLWMTVRHHHVWSLPAPRASNEDVQHHAQLHCVAGKQPILIMESLYSSHPASHFRA